MKRYIHADIEVWTGYSKKLLDNNRVGSGLVEVRVAPGIDGGEEWVYLRAQGNKTKLLGHVDDRDRLVLHESTLLWIEQSKYSWLRACTADVSSMMDRPGSERSKS